MPHEHNEEEKEEEEEEVFFTLPSHDSLVSCLRDDTAPIAKRMRSVFLLKQLSDSPAIAALCEGLSSASVLLAHECAYVLGQIRDPSCLPSLRRYLQLPSVHPIVRHECAEAIAALGDRESLDILQLYVDDDSCPEVRDTCRIAIAKLEWHRLHSSSESPAPPSKYASVDPAPPLPSTLRIQELQSKLMDTSLSLFERYRAMFSLRDNGSDDAVSALSLGLTDDSAVFRHEVAYVLGQMQRPAALEALSKRLEDGKEHPMVRHEAAEAIGSIAETAMADLLGRYREDRDDIVKESCEVALDLVEYWNSDEVCTAVKDKEEEQVREEDGKTKGITGDDGIAVQSYVRKPNAKAAAVD